MSFRYDLIEQAIQNALQPIQNAAGHSAFELCRPYEGEFQAPWMVPEDYHPGKRYALIQVQTASGSTGGRSSVFDVSVSGQCAVFIGSESSSRKSAKSDVYENINLARKALHGGKVTIDGDAVEFLWNSDNLEFSVPNHMCFSLVMNFIIRNLRLQP